jgi:hypothetical protein
MIITLIVSGTILFISGLFITICLIWYSRILKKFSLDLSDDNLVKSQSCPSIPITNNYQSGNQKELSISISQTSSLLPFEHEDFILDNLFHKTKSHDDYVDFL